MKGTHDDEIELLKSSHKDELLSQASTKSTDHTNAIAALRNESNQAIEFLTAELDKLTRQSEARTKQLEVSLSLPPSPGWECTECEVDGLGTRIVALDDSQIAPSIPRYRTGFSSYLGYDDRFSSASGSREGFGSAREEGDERRA